MPKDPAYRSFRDFYPFYLSQHENQTCRRLHFAGSALALIALIAAIATLDPWLLILIPMFGYGFAWIGHIRFERNRPATFAYPLYSLIGDWVMFWNLLTGRASF